MFWNPRQHLMEMLWSLWGSPLCPSKLAYDWISCQPPLGNQMRFDSHIHCCSSSNHCSKVFESVQFFERFTICSVQPKVEKARSCIHLTKENYPMSCIFSDILQLVQNPPREDNWSPSKLKLKRSYECQQHENTYLISTYVFMNFSRVWGHRVSIQVDPICAGAQLLWEMTVVALLGVRAFSSPGTNLSSTNQVYFSGPRSQLFLIQVCFKVWSEGRLRESQEEASSWCCYYVHAPNPCECAWECSWFWRGQELLGLCLWSLSLSAFCFSPSPGRNIWRSTSHGIRSKQPRGELGESRIRLDISPPLSPNAFWGCAHDSSGIQTPANGVGELCMTLPRRNGPVYTLCKRYLKWSLHLEIVSWIWILQHTMWQPQSNVKTRQSMKLNFPGENISTKTASVPLKRIWSFGVHMLKKEFLK